MFVFLELVNYIDCNYKMIVDWKGCVIIGFSMGGYGVMWLGICYKDVFGVVGSISGGVDICFFFKNWSMNK